MATETAAGVVPPEVFQNIEQLHGEVGNLQRELTQATDVWQTTLADEKKRFEELLGHKELAWQEQDAQWSRQSQIFAERLTELQSDFESRLKQAEQNAARALTELDDAWQRDKLQWGPAAQSAWPAQRRELEAKAQALEERLAALESAHTDERAMFQARILELESADVPLRVIETGDESALTGIAAPTPETVKALEGQLTEFQQTVASLQDRAAHSDELVNACVQALDYQISVLYDLVHHSTSPSELAKP